MPKELYQLNKTLISKGNCVGAGSILYVHHRDEDGNIFCIVPKQIVWYYG